MVRCSFFFLIGSKFDVDFSGDNPSNFRYSGRNMRAKYFRLSSFVSTRVSLLALVYPCGLELLVSDGAKLTQCNYRSHTVNQVNQASITPQGLHFFS